MATLRDHARHAVLVAGVAVAVGLVGASHPEPVPMPTAETTSAVVVGIDAPSGLDALEQVCQAANELGEHAGDQAEKRHHGNEQADILAEDWAWRLKHQLTEPA